MTPATTPRTPRWSVAVVGALSVVAFAVAMYAGRGTAPFYDEWTWLTLRRGANLATLLEPHNGHLSLVPLLAHKALYAITGLEHYWLHRAVTAALHVTVGLLVFRFAASRWGGATAVIPAGLILGLGMGAEDFLWPFQIGFLLSIGGGTVALMALASARRRSGLVALVALTIAVASSGIGVVFLGAAIVWAALDRQPQKAAAVGIPTVLYLVWYAAYGAGNGQAKASNLPDVPDYMVSMGSAGLGGLAGLGPEIGTVLLVLAVIGTAVVLARPQPVAPLLAALLVAPLALWALTALSRAELGDPGAARYIYPSAVLIVLAAVQLLHRWQPTSRTRLVAGGVALFCVAAGADDLRTESRLLRGNAELLEAQVAAFSLLPSPQVPGDFQPAPDVTPQLHAADLPGLTRAYGPLVEDPARELTQASPAARNGADASLLRAGAITTGLSDAGLTTGAGGSVGLYTPEAGNVETTDGCAEAEVGSGQSEITVAPGRSVVIATEKPASLAFRRFGDGYGPAGQRPLPAEPVVVSAAKDRVAVPVVWRVQLTGGGKLRACTK